MIRQNIHHRDSLTAQEYRELQAEQSKKSNSKFGNTWVIIDGLKFQSIAEGNYYGKLKMRKLAGDIKSFSRHKVWKFIHNEIFICSYECDFAIVENDDSETVVDVKSEATEALYIFKLKQKMMKAFFGIDVKVVK